MDDEHDARMLLTNFIENYCPLVDIINSFENPLEALDYLSANNSEISLIYLDISMPQLNGIDFLKKCSTYELQVIFVTAHNEFAIQAIRLSALDYILKPINIDELVGATNKAIINRANAMANSKKLEGFVSNAIRPFDKQKISLDIGNEIVYKEIKDIIYLEADGNYTFIHFENLKKVIVIDRIGNFETLLEGFNFFRVHRSYLVNIGHISRYIKGRGGIIVLSNGHEVPIAQRSKLDFLERINKK